MKTRISQKRIIQELQAFYVQHERSPRHREWLVENGFPFARNCISRTFGSWNNGLRAAGIPLNVSMYAGKVVQCAECGEEIYRVPSQLKEANFCSTGCKNRWYGKKNKKPETSICQICGKTFIGQRKYCDQECRWRATSVPQDTTLADYKDGITNFEFHAKIRGLARTRLKASSHPKMCAICGYDKHVECCHKIPIADFTDSDTIGDVNALSNLLWLCPNHHWEVDHGLVEL